MVSINYSDPNGVLTKLKDAKFQDISYFKLNHLANEIQLKGKKEELMSVDDLKSKITLFPHQLETALRYLNEMNGRIVLADEVGLGKTIEAGIILKEIIARSDSNIKILILTPASLKIQWQIEMNDKFGIYFEINNSVHHWNSYNKIISSIDTAKNPKHINEIKEIKWDVLIIDEAHKLKNSSTKAHKAIKEIVAENKLFLTATPLQNSLIELFNVIDLLDSGYLGTLPEFKRNYLADDKGLELSHSNDLKDLLQGIMSRTTRKEADLEFTKRRVSTTLIEPSSKEIEFMDLAFDFIREEYGSIKDSNEKKGQGTLVLMTLARMLCSCRYSFGISFKKYLDNHIIDPVKNKQGMKILDLNESLRTHNKFEKVIELVKKINEQVIVFTQFKNTQSALEEELSKSDLKIETINGSMSADEKNYALRKFRQNKANVLICTETASEGLNMQFCHNLINYDLAWNPMRIEQRIGRIHRIGQEYDVNIYNLAIKGTVEEYILEKLYKKINLFHLAIGEMADIVTRVIDEDSFDKTIFDIIIGNRKKIDVQKKMNELFEKIKKSKKFQEDIEQLDEKTLNIFDLSPVKNESK